MRFNHVNQGHITIIGNIVEFFVDKFPYLGTIITNNEYQTASVALGERSPDPTAANEEEMELDWTRATNPQQHHQDQALEWNPQGSRRVGRPGRLCTAANGQESSSPGTTSAGTWQSRLRKIESGGVNLVEF
ncbi:hypothetical protein ACLKA6_017260 [Drosophila palustris]